MSACKYCVYRNSWDCDDGCNQRKNCKDFKLDFSALSPKQKKAIQRILEKEDE